MAVWLAVGIACLIMGLVLSLFENWARGEAIPHWRILGLGVGASLIGGLVTLGLTGRFIVYVPIVLTILALMVDRLNDRMRQGL